jgi:hypothetical protein
MISYNTSIVRSGLVLHLDAANVKSYPGTGTAWNDLTGNVNNAPLKNGTITYSNGSFVFDGVVGSFFYDAVVALPNSSSNITILCWCKPDSTGPVNSYTGLVAVGGSTSSTPSDAVLLCLNTNAATWHVGSAYWSNDYNPSNLPVVKDAWNMVGIVARSAATTNNTTLISANSTGFTTLTGSSSGYTKGLSITQVKLRVGSTDTNGARPMKGEIAIVMIYNRELTLAEITQNFEATRNRYGI